MAELLERKRREGLDVRIVVSTLGSRPFREAKTMYRRLADAGAAIVADNALPVDRDGLYRVRTVDWLQDEVGRVDHRKLIVIDGAVAWTGGAGIEDHFADGRFHDVMVRVTGDVVRQLQAVFLTSFRAYGGPLPPHPGALAEHFRGQEDPGTIPTVVLQVMPGGFQSATQAIRERLDAVLHDVATEYEARHSPAIKRVWDDAIAGIGADLREWLRRMTAEDTEWIPAHFELSFGLKDPRAQDAKSKDEPVQLDIGLRLRGSIGA